MNPIKQIKEGNITPEVHKAFTRYSLGIFEKEQFIVKVSKKVTIQSGFEYLNYFHQFLAENVSGEVEMNGVIESVRSLDIPIKYEEKRRFGKPGTKYLFSKQTVTAADYQRVVKEFGNEFLLFGIKTEGIEMKVKGKTTPKLGKPTEKFVTLKLSPELFKKFREIFLYDVKGDFKQAILQHTYTIKDIKLDEKLLETDPKKAREDAIRVGEILRKVTIGEETTETTIPFEV